MYDYITITDSEEKTEITVAYSEPKGGIRRKNVLYEKKYGKYTVTKVTTSGTERTDIISEAEFFWEYGAAFGAIAPSPHD